MSSKLESAVGVLGKKVFKSPELSSEELGALILACADLAVSAGKQLFEAIFSYLREKRARTGLFSTTDLFMKFALRN